MGTPGARAAPALQPSGVALPAVAGKAQSTPRDSAREVLAGPWLVSTTHFQRPGLPSGDSGARAAPGIAAAG